jgi:ribonuclease HI
MRKKVRLITDGSCLGNPGPGGWAVILKYGQHTKEMYGHEPHTTNNKMELTAAVEGLKALKEPCEVEVKTDSEYVRNGIMTWVAGWKRNGWQTKAKSPVANRDLWEALDAQAARHQTQWVWTKGHAEDAENNRCDELAQMAARQQVTKR